MRKNFIKLKWRKNMNEVLDSNVNEQFKELII